MSSLLQMPNTAAVFPPNGNMDAMIHIVLHDVLVPTLSCLYFYLPNMYIAVLCVFKIFFLV